MYFFIFQASSPSSTELENIMLDWLVRALDLPDFFLAESNGGGVIQVNTLGFTHIDEYNLL